MTERLLHWAIALNLITATILLLLGDEANAMLGFVGAGCFGLALIVSEWS